MEKWIIRFLLLASFATLLVHTMADQDPVEENFEVGRLMEEAQQSPVIKLFPSGINQGKEEGLLTLTLEDFWSNPNLVIKVDGKRVGTFKQKQVTLKVLHGQQVSIEDLGRNFTGRVTVSHSTSNLKTPVPETLGFTNNRIYLQKVEIGTP